LWQILVQLRQRWDKENGKEESNMSLGNVDQSLADDYMLDFGMTAPQHSQIMFDDTLDLLDIDNIPWYA
jgi:hypothetical protein